jgi:serine/threonine-protein kinase
LADRYTIERELGAGGMATVYLATDVRHGRRVAIKVLHPTLSSILGPDRFLAEIKLTAALQHPHILPLFDSGRIDVPGADDLLYYVMPFVAGETLRSRLERERQLPVKDAVRIATEVADALEHAHRNGIVHRDIKPENILLREGHALVADFGIALAVQQAGGQRMTETGMSVGTPQYMAPEQAMGDKSVDHRADVYALGAVTYEMLAGEPPFTGPTAQAIVAQVLTEGPRPLVGRRQRISPEIEDAVLRALEKLPADRFASAAEFSDALGGHRAVPLRRARTRSSRRSGAALAAGAILLATVAFVAGRWTAGSRARGIALGQSMQLTSEPGLEVHPAISPDGRAVAYAGGTSAQLRIYVRQVAGGRALPLTSETDDVQSNPRWSPDGTRILYLSRGGVFSAPAGGGAPQQEVAAPVRPVATAAWGPNGQIAYGFGDSLFLRSADGNARFLAMVPDVSLCHWSPDGASVACAMGNAAYVTPGATFGNRAPSRITVIDVGSGRALTVGDSLSVHHSPVWSPDGRSIFFISDRHGTGDIYVMPASDIEDAVPERLTVGSGAQTISLSSDGSRLAYAAYAERVNVWSVPFPARPPATPEQASPMTSGNQFIESIAVDGGWLVYDATFNGNTDVYRVPLAGGDVERLTTEPDGDFHPRLSPDGREVLYHNQRSGSRDLYVKPLDGRPVQQVTRTSRQEAVGAWSPDGSMIAFQEYTPSGGGGIWIVRRKADGTWEEPVRRGGPGITVSWSPDGRSLAYTTSWDGGSIEVLPVDSGPARVVLDASRPGVPRAELPLWSSDGRSIYYKSHDAEGNASIWSVPAIGGAPRMLLHWDDPARPSYRDHWTFSNDRILLPVQERESDVRVVEVVEGR